MKSMRRSGAYQRRGRSRRRASQGTFTGRLLRGVLEFALIVVLLFFAASLLGLFDAGKQAAGRKQAEEPWDPRQTEVLPAVVSELGGGGRPLAAMQDPAEESLGAAAGEAGPDGLAGSAGCRLHLANGCAVSKLAGRARDAFQQAGFDVRGVSNADGDDYDETVVVDRSGDRRSAEVVLGFLRERWGVGRLVLQARRGEAVDILVILGADIAERIAGEPARPGVSP